MVLVFRVCLTISGLAFLVGCTQVDTPSSPLAQTSVFAQNSAKQVVQTNLAQASGLPRAAAGVFGSSLAHFGDYLITIDMRTLYTFDADPIGTSTCYGSCQAQWPPYLASDDAKLAPNTSFVSRSDGTRQWAARGKPVYLYAGDKKLGEKNGEFISGWRVAPYQP